jgi:putative glutamine amidotransferase
MKKRIGISFTTTKWENYNTWFSRQGLDEDVELIDLSFERNNEAEFDKCDGFVLTGGVDIHPSFYGGDLKYNGQPNAFQLQRDVFEKKMFMYANAHNKPILGICRGLQLLNVLQGGKLIQDLGLAGNLIHKGEGAIDKQHDIRIEKGTLFHKITNLTAGTVNSAHHQVVDPKFIGKNLKVNAWSADGIIEGLEYADKANKPFMLCVQWHPERLPEQQGAFSKNVLNSFLEAIENPSMKSKAFA